jgi:hypothetical protein
MALMYTTRDHKARPAAMYSRLTPAVPKASPPLSSSQVFNQSHSTMWHIPFHKFLKALTKNLIPTHIIQQLVFDTVGQNLYLRI